MGSNTSDRNRTALNHLNIRITMQPPQLHTLSETSQVQQKYTDCDLWTVNCVCVIAVVILTFKVLWCVLNTFIKYNELQIGSVDLSHANYTAVCVANGCSVYSIRRDEERVPGAFIRSDKERLSCAFYPTRQRTVCVSVLHVSNHNCSIQYYTEVCRNNRTPFVQVL